MSCRTKINDRPHPRNPRLILRAQRRDDFAFYAATRADAAYMRYMADGAANSEEQSWASFLRMAGQWAMSGFGGWMVEAKGSGALVGDVGFIDRKRDRGSELKDIVEMGWGIAPAHAGEVVLIVIFPRRYDG